MSDGLRGWIGFLGPTAPTVAQTSATRLILSQCGTNVGSCGKVCFATAQKVSRSRSWGPLCAHVHACAAGVSVTCLFCSVLTDPPHPALHSYTFRMRREVVLKIQPHHELKRT